MPALDKSAQHRPVTNDIDQARHAGRELVHQVNGMIIKNRVGGTAYLQTMPHMMADSLIADAVAVISSVDPILGEVDR